ncbi:MAG: hypothetical protein L3J17_07865 [Candidatus Jettenia sp.]|nr:MAG: hypothetical protein L3J17_07865 [Candidatus Jettenia sp.]
MKYIKWCAIAIGIIISGIPALSNAFDIQLTPEQIHEADEYGKKYKGKDIFYSDTVKQACFGEYPKGPGGLIMSKYMRIAVTSAMHAMKEKTLTAEDIKEIQHSTTFNVVVNIDEDIQALEDVQIMLKQGTNIILPQNTEFGMKYKDRRQSVVGIFPYDKINPNANTTILIKTRKDQKEYKIDFSDVK